jgi:patatin-like phospholipase/acyl hydrolase
MAGLVKVLSIDGGGIRGIIPAHLLAAIERETDAPICELFDLIAGTSTGGIIALGLTAPGPDGKPARSAEDLVHLYSTEGKTIFSRSIWHEIRAVGSALEEKYPASGVEDVLKECLGEETRLKDALTRVLITAYEIEDRIPWFFSSRDAASREDYDFPMWQVGRATSAAPTYFEPAHLPASNARGYWTFVDGGVFANNPALCGLVEATSVYQAEHDGEVPDVFLVSLGTGELTRTIQYDRAKAWGLVGWAQPILNVVFDGVSKTVGFQAQQLCRATEGMPERFYRFQVNLAQYGNDDMDDASGTNILALEKLAEDLIASRKADLDTLCAQLKAS